MRRGMEIDVVAVIAVEQVIEAFHLRRQIIAAGKGDELAEEVRMPKNQAGGLEGPETAAHRHRAILEGGVPADAVGRMTPRVVEGLPRQPLSVAVRQRKQLARPE